MNITPPFFVELRHRLESMAASKLQDWITLNKAECTYLLALLDEAQKAEPTIGERKRLLTRLAVMSNHYKDTMFMGDYPPLGVKAHDADVEAIRSLILSRPAPASVTREWFQKLATSILYHHGTNEAEGIMWPEAKAMLLEQGVSVKD